MGFSKPPFLSSLRVVLLASVIFFAGCGGDKQAVVGAAPQAGSAELEAHSAEFERAVVEVTDGIYVAIGYALANSIMIVATTASSSSIPPSPRVRHAWSRPSSTRLPINR